MNNFVKLGDRYFLKSENNKEYIITIIDINECRPPDTKYAVNVVDAKDNSYYKEYGDFWFCGDELINKCTKID